MKVITKIIKKNRYGNNYFYVLTERGRVFFTDEEDTYAGKPLGMCRNVRGCDIEPIFDISLKDLKDIIKLIEENENEKKLEKK